MNLTRQKVRLIIPVWGLVYARKLTTMTLPAILSPNNLPALCENFDVECVIVTEQNLFGEIRQAPSFQKVSQLCSTKFVPLDDLLTGVPGDYGPVLTLALFRGFTDLGEKMTDTYLLFLNADFIIADGSYRHLGELMLRGHRVIHAPSFRVSLEDIWPILQDRLSDSVLSMGTREMVELALKYRHLTVHARTVTQGLYHQWRMDQFYWPVNDDTLIGYQWPVALVAIKPECVVTKPVLVWDYGFIPEASPNLDRYFIHDSDDFFMLEPQKKSTGDEMIRLGAITADDIAKDLSLWTTKEQRECGQELFKIHAQDLPPNLDDYVDQSKRYMHEIMVRLSPVPQPHIGHGMLGVWFDSVIERIESGPLKPIESDVLEQTESKQAEATGPQRDISDARKPRSSIWGALSKVFLGILRWAHNLAFGRFLSVHRWHPLWLDSHEVVSMIERWKRGGQTRILWITSRDSFFHKFLSVRVDPTSFMMFMQEGPSAREEPYDVCFCELTPFELVDLKRLFGEVRARVKSGGDIIVNVFNPNDEPVGVGIFTPYETIFPAPSDYNSSISFYGTFFSALIRRLYYKAARSNSNRPVLRALLTGVVMVMLAPLTWIVNTRAAARNPHIYNPYWTTVVINYNVAKLSPDVQPRASSSMAPRPSNAVPA